jgi:CRISPR-associated endonuclease/helicase Cas3
VLDRFFWRIGDRTWRGTATNACLDRVARELREVATRNTAVMIQEVRSSKESRAPMIIIGSRTGFSPTGLVPVSTHPARFPYGGGLSETAASFRAVVQIAALFHDLGKAMVLFQAKLDAALAGQQTVPDAIRHELISAVVWDHLAGDLEDAALIEVLRGITPERIEKACVAAVAPLVRLHAQLQGTNGPPLILQFERVPQSLAFQIGALILAHHRLPNSDVGFSQFHASRHVNREAPLGRQDLAVAPGTPFWREDWWLHALRRAAEQLRPDFGAHGLDMVLRASLMFADHVGSSRSAAKDSRAGHLANTRDGRPADSLAEHVRKVHNETRGAFDMLHRSRDRFPGLLETEIPVDVAHPQIVVDRFRWQEEAAFAARSLCGSAAGGFFGCILSGTGSGKTRGAPTILAGASFGDTLPERRVLRMTLGLGLRALATQSADEYVRELGFSDRAVSVLVGQPPINFLRNDPDDDASGAESRISVPDWLRIESARGGVPEPGSEAEAGWLRGLSLDMDRQLSAFCAEAVRVVGVKAHVFRKLIETPILVATIDHLMGVAAPMNSRFLPQAVRVLTSDLILDEIDQYEPEDLAALCRLAYQVGAGGRRLMIMSATLTADVAEAFFHAYRAGWSAHAAISGTADAVNVLCTGDMPGSCVTAPGAEKTGPIFDRCRSAILTALYRAPALRRGRILPPCDSWGELIIQMDKSCSTMHDDHATMIDGIRVSVGLVRMTRVSHTAAMAAQLPAGLLRGRLRLKVCLHSRFPRLHRAWIEMLLKRALTRKQDPDVGITNLCRQFGVFERAAQAGVMDVELVVVASPVIETGNDLDFDYAVIDPVSLRAVIQTAGRVNRHRLRPVATPNVILLSRSPIAMETGRLGMPGVETPPARDTNIARVTLDAFPGRHTSDLIGAETIAVITARALLSEEGHVELRAAEARLRRAMIDVLNPSSPSARYLASPLARLSAATPRLRCFRRSTTQDLVYALFGESANQATWHVDLAPGTKNSRFQPANVCCAAPELDPKGFLIRGLTERAWRDLVGNGVEIDEATMCRLLCVEVPDYGTATELVAPMCYSELTGLTRGKPGDLSCPFGKTI